MRVTGVTVRSAITGDGEDCHWSERDEAEKRKKQCECHAYVQAARPPPLIRPSGRVHGVDNVISREVYCYCLEVWKGIDRTERDSTQDRRDDTILGSVQHSTVQRHNDIATQPHLTPAVYLKTCGILDDRRETLVERMDGIEENSDMYSIGDSHETSKRNA